MPAPGSADYEAYNEWLHYSEGSAMLPLMLNLYVSRLKEAGAPLHPRIDSETRQPSRLCRRRAEGPRVLRRPVADRRRYPDELCRRDGKSVREARTRIRTSRPGCRACTPGRRSSGRWRRAGRTGLRDCAVVIPAARAEPDTPRAVGSGTWRTPSLPNDGRWLWAPAQGRGDGRRRRSRTPSSPPYLA